MPQISKPDDKPLDPKGKVNLDAMLVPSFRIVLAVERGIEHNLLIHTCGGLGDLICAEPAIRFAIERFKTESISLYSLYPELYSHLKFKKVYDEKLEKPDFDKYFVFKTMMDADCLAAEFMAHLITNAVDYTSINMWRCQLPIKEKVPTLIPSIADFESVSEITRRDIAIHPGSGWQSKTFPKDWWDIIIATIREGGFNPVIIGSNSVLNHGTVDIETFGCRDFRNKPFGCRDFRNKLTVMQSVALLQKVGCLLTNDSAPFHMAASGEAWIGYIATAKHPDYIGHWRGPKPEFNWRMQNLGHGGVWDTMNMCPNHKAPIEIDIVNPQSLTEWLPDPQSVAEWAMEKIDGLHESGCD